MLPCLGGAPGRAPAARRDPEPGRRPTRGRTASPSCFKTRNSLASGSSHAPRATLSRLWRTACCRRSSSGRGRSRFAGAPRPANPRWSARPIRPRVRPMPVLPSAHRPATRPGHHLVGVQERHVDTVGTHHHLHNLQPARRFRCGSVPVPAGDGWIPLGPFQHERRLDPLRRSWPGPSATRILQPRRADSAPPSSAGRLPPIDVRGPRHQSILLPFLTPRALNLRRTAVLPPSPAAITHRTPRLTERTSEPPVLPRQLKTERPGQPPGLLFDIDSVCLFLIQQLAAGQECAASRWPPGLELLVELGGGA